MRNMELTNLGLGKEGTLLINALTYVKQSHSDNWCFILNGDLLGMENSNLEHAKRTANRPNQK